MIAHRLNTHDYLGKRRRRLVAKMHAFVNPNDLRFVVDEKSSNYQEASRLGCSADVWLRLLYQVDTNSYHTWTDRSRLLDTKILLPTCMLLNHSCDPNVRMTLRKNGSASIRAMRDITCGEELTICYNDDWVDADYAERSKHAASGWGFSCECKRCKRETSLVVYEEKKSQF